MKTTNTASKMRKRRLGYFVSLAGATERAKLEKSLVKPLSEEMACE